MGRPLKINDNFIQATKQIIQNDDLTPVAWTDDDFLDQVNDKLKKEDQISDCTFDSYIQKTNTNNPTLKEFLGLLKKGREKVKIALLKELRAKPERWQALAWILERKFTEFNLKQISEHKFDIQPIKIVIDLNTKPIEKPKKSKETKINITEAEVLETQIN